jgi:hypothetical protein
MESLPRDLLQAHECVALGIEGRVDEALPETFAECLARHRLRLAGSDG